MTKNNNIAKKSTQET